jgi:hypothetical protein
VGLQALAVWSWKEYANVSWRLGNSGEFKAQQSSDKGTDVKIGLRSALFQGIRRKLLRGRFGMQDSGHVPAPLFDTEPWTRRFEDAVKQMWEVKLCNKD